MNGFPEEPKELPEEVKRGAEIVKRAINHIESAVFELQRLKQQSSIHVTIDALNRQRRWLRDVCKIEDYETPRYVGGPMDGARAVAWSPNLMHMGRGRWCVYRTDPKDPHGNREFAGWASSEKQAIALANGQGITPV